MLTFLLCFLGGVVLGYVFSQLRGNKLRTDFLILQEKLRMQEEARRVAGSVETSRRVAGFGSIPRISPLAGRGPKLPSEALRRCQLCGRPRGYLRKFKLCRLCFRELALKGEVPGITKASW